MSTGLSSHKAELKTYVPYNICIYTRHMTYVYIHAGQKLRMVESTSLHTYM